MEKQDLINQIQQWFTLAVPTPTTQNQSVQIGCHFEEIAEMVEAILDRSSVLIDYLHDYAGNFKYADSISTRIIKDILESPERSLNLRDALCDQIVTAIGIYHMMGWDIQADLNEVNRSNWSKFEDGKPLFNEHGKIIKGRNYSKPNLTPILKKD